MSDSHLTARTQRRDFWPATHVVEVLCRSHDVRRLLVLVVLHPALSKEFPVCVWKQVDSGEHDGESRRISAATKERDLLPLTRMG